MKGYSVVMLAMLLGACGGGGGGGSPSSAVTNAIAAGVWQGTSSSGYTVDLIVLPNNEFATIFGSPLGSGLFISGFDSGTGTITGNTLAASISEYTSTGLTAIGNVSATITNNTSVIGSTAYSNGATSNFSFSPLPNFNYNTPASLSTVSGSWNGTLLDGETTSVTVNSSTGAFSGLTSSGCSFTGVIAPVASVNVYTTTITMGNSPCANPNVTAPGIAFAYLTGSGTTQLIAEAATGSFGMLFSAQR